jgi:hypothetical protein
MYDTSLGTCGVHKKDVAQDRDASKRKAGPPWREDISEPGSRRL